MNTRTQGKRVVVVGAGVGGLAAAARLAHQGFDVQVFEKTDGPGGRCNQLKAEGFTIVLVEQNFRFAQTVADRHYIVEQGRVIDEIPNSTLFGMAESFVPVTT